MDAASIMNIYEEAFDEALDKGVDNGTAHKEAVTAAAMFLSATDGVEDAAARAQVEEVVAADEG